MVKLQHRHRREGGITVGSTRYELDSEGIVEVSVEHAKALGQGSLWRNPGSWGVIKKKTEPKIQPGGGRRARTKEELLGLSIDEGLVKPEPIPEPIPEPEAEPVVEVTESEVEEVTESEIVASLDMSKNQLLEVVEQLGLELPQKALTKRQILQLIKAAQEE